MMADIFTTLDQARSVKRYGFGPEYTGGVSVPEIIEQPNGPYVTYTDYLKALELVERRSAVIKILEAEIDQMLAETPQEGAAGVNGTLFKEAS